MDLARRATAAIPEKIENWITLGRLLLDGGDNMGADSVLDDAFIHFPNHPALLNLRLRTLEQRGDYEGALDAVRAAVALDPENPGARVFHFMMLARTQSPVPDAVLDDMMRLAPFNGRLFEFIRRERGAQALLEHCIACLAVRPGHADARHYRALAMVALGRADEARAALSTERLVTVTELPVPPPYDDMQGFCRALSEEIHTNPTLEPDPRGRSTREGRQARVLRQPGAVAVEALVSQIKQAVQNHVAGLTEDGRVGMPDRARLNIWAVIHDAQGYQESHRHPDGWVSGVFYVAAQRPKGRNAYQGPLLLGALNPKHYPGEPPWGVREIEPVPGRLLIFPSYVPHATAPAGVPGPRISVAFDVIPVA